MHPQCLRCIQDGVRTPGILTREGVSRGLAPTVEVLSIGRKNRSREASDPLPYLPAFKRFFEGLPKKTAEMELKIMRVPLSDIDCITKTTAKVELRPPCEWPRLTITDRDR